MMSTVLGCTDPLNSDSCYTTTTTTTLTTLKKMTLTQPPRFQLWAGQLVELHWLQSSPSSASGSGGSNGPMQEVNPKGGKEANCR